MTRLIVIFALATTLSGCASSPFASTPASAVQPTGIYATPGIPQSQYECVTDEGYGRWSPCGAAD